MATEEVDIFAREVAMFLSSGRKAVAVAVLWDKKEHSEVANLTWYKLAAPLTA